MYSIHLCREQKKEFNRFGEHWAYREWKWLHNNHNNNKTNRNLKLQSQSNQIHIFIYFNKNPEHKIDRKHVHNNATEWFIAILCTAFKMMFSYWKLAKCVNAIVCRTRVGGLWKYIIFCLSGDVDAVIVRFFSQIYFIQPLSWKSHSHVLWQYFNG